MSTLITIQDVSRRSGLSGPTLRYYEEIGLIGPIGRDASSPQTAVLTGTGISSITTHARTVPSRPGSVRRAW